MPAPTGQAFEGHFRSVLKWLAPLALSVALTGAGFAVATHNRSEIAVAPNTSAIDWVTDNANIFSPSFKFDLTKKLVDLQKDAGPQIAVYTTSSLGGVPINKYSFDLANRSGIGDGDRNDGVMILVAPNERQVRIEVGSGLEATLSNDLCSQVIENKMIPFYRDGDYESGTLSGVDALISVLRARPTRTTQGSQQ